MNTNRQVFRNNTSASAASLTGVGRLHGNDRNTSAFSLVFQHLPEYAKTSVMRRQRKVRVSVHERECQVFNCNQVVLLNQTFALFVKVVSALMFNVFVQSGDLLIGLALPLTALDLPAGMALQPAKFRKAISQPMWVLDKFFSRKPSNVFQPNVHANLSASRFSGNVRIRQIQRKRNIPAPVPPGDISVLDGGVFRDTAMIANPYFAHILYIKSNSAIVACSQFTAIPIGVFNRIEAAARFETRKTGFFAGFQSAEKCGIRPVKTAKCLLQTGRVDQAQRIGIVSSKVSEVLPLRRVSNSLTVFLVRVDSLLKGKIVNKPMLPHKELKGICLFIIWAKEVLIYPQHKLALLVLDVLFDNFLRHHSYGTNVVTPAPKAWEAGTQLRKLLAQLSGGVSLELVGEALWRFRRIAFHKQANVVWHDFKRHDGYAELFCFLVEQGTEFFDDLAYKYFSPVFRTPHEVVFQGVNTSRIAPVSYICRRTYVLQNSFSVKYLI